jgi:hypothetical protein
VSADEFFEGLVIARLPTNDQIPIWVLDYDTPRDSFSR